MKEPTAKMGFPPGVAKKLVLTAFKHYEELAKEYMKKREEATQHATAKMETVDTPPVAVQEEVMTSEEKISSSNNESEVTTQESNDKSDVSPDTTCEVTDADHPPLQMETSDAMSTDKQKPDDADETNASLAAGTDESVKTDGEEPGTIDIEDSVAVELAEGKGDGDAEKNIESATPDDTIEHSLEKKESAANDSDDEELTRMQKVFQENPESYNGAIRDNYSWSQSITDLDVRVKVPKHISRGKDVKVDILRKKLRCGYLDKDDGQWKMVIDEDLTWEVNKEESMWSLVPGEHIHVNLEKVQERWWEGVLVSEPKISVRKIDPSRPMTDLDDAAQSKIEEMMYNERQKKLGLPQSHEKKTHEILKSAWDAEGSPFKGTPFDPSRLNITPPDGGMMNFPQK